MVKFKFKFYLHALHGKNCFIVADLNGGGLFGELVRRYGLGELVGAGGVVPAHNSREQLFNFVNIFALYKAADALKVAAAASDKFNVVQNVVVVHLKVDLA